MRQCVIAKGFIELGCEMNLTNSDGHDILVTCIINKRPEIAKILIERGNCFL